jgi:hypothetical protein
MHCNARTRLDRTGLIMQRNACQPAHLVETMMNDTQNQQPGKDQATPPQTPDELIGDLPPDAIQSDANDNSFVADLPEEGTSKPGAKDGQKGV